MHILRCTLLRIWISICSRGSFWLTLWRPEISAVKIAASQNLRVSQRGKIFNGHRNNHNMSFWGIYRCNGDYYCPIPTNMVDHFFARHKRRNSHGSSCRLWVSKGDLSKYHYWPPESFGAWSVPLEFQLNQCHNWILWGFFNAIFWKQRMRESDVKMRLFSEEPSQKVKSVPLDET